MPELRKDPITGRWVIIATDRAKRPTDFVRQTVPPPSGGVCPFDYGNEHKTPPEVLAFRDSGGRDEPGWRVRVVPNKFPVLGIEGELNRQGEGMYDKMNGIGAHEVIIETPNHSLTLAEMPERQIEEVLWAFRDRVNDLKKDRRFRYIILFKNHGEAAGASLEHPHSQLIALPVIPKRVKEEVDGARVFYEMKERCIFCDIIRQETAAGVRLVMRNGPLHGTGALCAAVSLRDLDSAQAARLAFRGVGCARRCRTWHGCCAPPCGRSTRCWSGRLTTSSCTARPVQDPPLLYYHWHIEIIPKLTKVAGFEWGTGFYINPTPPEESARFLREAGLG